MYKRAGKFGAGRFAVAEIGGGRPIEKRTPIIWRYAVHVFLLRKDNRGDKRLFRYPLEFERKKEALEVFERRRDSGVYLYGIVFDIETMEELDSFGDPVVEDNWVETNQVLKEQRRHSS